MGILRIYKLGLSEVSYTKMITWMLGHQEYDVLAIVAKNEIMKAFYMRKFN